MAELPDMDGELALLLATALDGRLDGPQRFRLAELLRADPEAGRLYVRLVRLEVLLRRAQQAQQAQQAPALPQVPRLEGADVAGETGAADSQQPQPYGPSGMSDAMILRAIREDELPVEPEPIRPAESPVPKPASSRGGLRLVGRLAAAVALLLTGGVLAWVVFRPGPAPVVSPVPGPTQGRGPATVAAAVAVLTSTTDAAWDGTAPAPAAALAAGDRLRLRSGFAQVAFTGGATVVLEGPADFQVADPNQCTLQAGRLVAQAAPRANGFSVRSPSLVVTDRGTEFGMSVGPDQAAEAHVFQGQVDVALPPPSPPPEGSPPGPPAPPIRLTEGAAVRRPAGGPVRNIPAAPEAFIRALPPAGAGQAGPLPVPGDDVGDVSRPGSDAYAGGVYTLTGSGRDIWDEADAFRFVARPVTGDVTVVAQVLSQTNTHPITKAGVMIRASNDPAAAFADVVITPEVGVCFQWRSVDGQDLGPRTRENTINAPASAPVWVKVTRSGDSFSGYYSTDGIAWAQIGPAQTVTMPRSALAGLAVTSHDTAASSTARFRNVSVTQP